jgi:hypothetical protein
VLVSTAEESVDDVEHSESPVTTFYQRPLGTSDAANPLVAVSWTRKKQRYPSQQFRWRNWFLKKLKFDAFSPRVHQLVSSKKVPQVHVARYKQHFALGQRGQNHYRRFDATHSAHHYISHDAVRLKATCHVNCFFSAECCGRYVVMIFEDYGKGGG